MVAAAKPPPRRGVRRVVAGGVLAGLVVGGTAAGIARVRPAASARVDDADLPGDSSDGVAEPPA